MDVAAESEHSWVVEAMHPLSELEAHKYTQDGSIQFDLSRMLNPATVVGPICQQCGLNYQDASMRCWALRSV